MEDKKLKALELAQAAEARSGIVGPQTAVVLRRALSYLAFLDGVEIAKAVETELENAAVPVATQTGIDNTTERLLRGFESSPLP